MDWCTGQIGQSFPRYCISRPGCSTTCFCPLVIGKVYWMAVWQTQHLFFLEWGRKKTKRKVLLLRVAWSIERWTFSDHLFNQKYGRSRVLFPDLMNTRVRELWCGGVDVFIWTYWLPACCWLFYETILWRAVCPVQTVLRGFDAREKWKLQRKQTVDVPKWFKLYWPPVDKLIAWWAYKLEVLLIILSEIKPRNVAYPPQRHPVN